MNVEAPVSFDLHLRQLRERAGISRSKLAEKAGISFQAVWQLEARPAGAIKAATRARYLDALQSLTEASGEPRSVDPAVAAGLALIKAGLELVGAA